MFTIRKQFFHYFFLFFSQDFFILISEFSPTVVSIGKYRFSVFGNRILLHIDSIVRLLVEKLFHRTDCRPLRLALCDKSD